MLTKPRFGSRRSSGICPPSNPMATLCRARCPLVPRPAVLPRPEPSPRPLRNRFRRDPFGGLRFESSLAMGLPFHFCRAHEVDDLLDHPPNRGRVLEIARVVDLAQPEAAHGGAVGLVRSDHALLQRDAELLRARLRLFARAAFGGALSILCGHHDSLGAGAG